MKKLSILSVLLVIVLGTFAQHFTSNTTAVLLVYMQKNDGTQVVLTLNELNNQFNQLDMSGTLKVNSLTTDDPQVQALLDTAAIQTINYSTTIPEGDYVFNSTADYQFTSEVLMETGNFQSRFIMNYDINNRRTTNTNVFTVTCTAKLSLLNNLGISNSIFQDEVDFQFFQNVITLSY